MLISSLRKDQVFMEVAITIGELGTCDRGRVGAVITREGRAISWGYNGAPPGLPHCDENVHGWQRYVPPDLPLTDLDKWYELQLSLHGCRNATHAEANALASAARQGISTSACTMYVECTPCVVCTRSLVAAGIDRVVYARVYRDDAGLQLLYEAGIEVVSLG